MLQGVFWFSSADDLIVVAVNDDGHD